MTDSGRTVYGGGGITDEKIDSPKSNTFQEDLLVSTPRSSARASLPGKPHRGQRLRSTAISDFFYVTLVQFGLAIFSTKGQSAGGLQLRFFFFFFFFFFFSLSILLP